MLKIDLIVTDETGRRALEVELTDAPAELITGTTPGDDARVAQYVARTIGPVAEPPCEAGATRKLTDHIVEGDSVSRLTISALDNPGQGGACHVYAVDTCPDAEDAHGIGSCVIRFQNGPIKESGVNGITQEALAAIIIDRLRGFQSGRFHCEANQKALEFFEEGLQYLQTRTRERIARGVEGTKNL